MPDIKWVTDAGSTEEKGDPCDESECLSEDEDSDGSLDDFLASDEDDDISVVDHSEWAARPDLVDFVGLRVPRGVLETLAKTTAGSLVASKVTTPISFLRSVSPILCAFQSHGIIQVSGKSDLSFPDLETLVLSSRHQLSLPRTVPPPSTTHCAATTLSALLTFTSSVETLFSSSKSIAFEVSASPSPLEILCTQLSLAAVISAQAREALK